MWTLRREMWPSYMDCEPSDPPASPLAYTSTLLSIWPLCLALVTLVALFVLDSFLVLSLCTLVLFMNSMSSVLSPTLLKSQLHLLWQNVQCPSRIIYISWTVVNCIWWWRGGILGRWAFGFFYCVPQFKGKACWEYHFRSRFSESVHLSLPCASQINSFPPEFGFEFLFFSGAHFS